MKALVDTSVWSLALRRRQVNNDCPVVRELRELIAENGAVIIGPVRQELLSGIRSRDQYLRLRDHLRAFPDLVLDTADYECAAEYFTNARSHGLQVSNTDLLIVAVAHRRELPIFTTDGNVHLLTQVIPLRLHRSRFDNEVLSSER